MWKQVLKCLAMFAVMLVCVGVSRRASAQWVVSDPTNLIQNTSTALSEVDGVVNQIQQLAHELKQIEMMKKNLEKLSPDELGQLQADFRQLASLYDQARHIGMQWGQIGQQFDSLYEDYDPEADGLQGYERKRKKWEEQTEDSIRAAMIAHGVIDDYGGREADIDDLVDASDDADGALAAIQAGNRISAELVKQMMELTKIIVADSRAKLSFMKQKQMNDKASRARRHDQVMRDYNESEGYEQPPNQFPEIK